MKLYYTISEVAGMLNVNSSLLRFWETEFPQLRPAKNSHGSRTYTEKDIELVKRIYHLTKECGYTLDGAREQLKKRRKGTSDAEVYAGDAEAVSAVAADVAATASVPAAEAVPTSLFPDLDLQQTKDDVEKMRQQCDAAVAKLKDARQQLMALKEIVLAEE